MSAVCGMQSVSRQGFSTKKCKKGEASRYNSFVDHEAARQSL
jgi:hypothetical protein